MRLSQIILLAALLGGCSAQSDTESLGDTAAQTAASGQIDSSCARKQPSSCDATAALRCLPLPECSWYTTAHCQTGSTWISQLYACERVDCARDSDCAGLGAALCGTDGYCAPAEAAN